MQKIIFTICAFLIAFSCSAQKPPSIGRYRQPIGRGDFEKAREFLKRRGYLLYRGEVALIIYKKNEKREVDLLQEAYDCSFMTMCLNINLKSKDSLNSIVFRKKVEEKLKKKIIKPYHKRELYILAKYMFPELKKELTSKNFLEESAILSQFQQIIEQRRFYQRLSRKYKLEYESHRFSFFYIFRDPAFAPHGKKIKAIYHD